MVINFLCSFVEEVPELHSWVLGIGPSNFLLTKAEWRWSPRIVIFQSFRRKLPCLDGNTMRHYGCPVDFPFEHPPITWCRPVTRSAILGETSPRWLRWDPSRAAPAMAKGFLPFGKSQKRNDEFSQCMAFQTRQSIFSHHGWHQPCFGQVPRLQVERHHCPGPGSIAPGLIWKRSYNSWNHMK